MNVYDYNINKESKLRIYYYKNKNWNVINLKIERVQLREANTFK